MATEMRCVTRGPEIYESIDNITTLNRNSLKSIKIAGIVSYLVRKTIMARRGVVDLGGMALFLGELEARNRSV
jgi:hypothetical protein